MNKTLADKNGRYILAETSIDETNTVFVNIYAPNDPSQQILFLRDLSSSVLFAYANENLVLGGDFNCVMIAMDKVHSFVDPWRIVILHNIGFTWSNKVDKDAKQTWLFFHPKIFAKVNSRMQNHAQHLLRSFCFNSHYLFWWRNGASRSRLLEV